MPMPALEAGGGIHPMSRAALGFIEQGQDQTVFGVVLDMSGMRGVVPGPKRPHSPVVLRWRRARSMTTWFCASVAATSST